jgi:hypothetical protein
MPDGDARRWLGVGRSADADARAAGAAATRAALHGQDARLLLVFGCALHDPHELLAGVRAVAAGVPLIGCSTTATIAPDGPTEELSVVVVALGGPGFAAATAAGRDVSQRRRLAGADVAECVTDDPDRPNRVLVLLSDGLVQNPEEIVSGVYGVVGASVPLVGGSACPDPSMARTWQLCDDAVLTDAMVGAAISSDGPFAIGRRHGWRPVGEPMIVTQSDRGHVYTVDDEPAAPAYLRRLGAPPAAFVDPRAFEQFAERRPIGVRSRGGEVVRNVGSSSHLARGWLHSSGDVPEGALIWPMDGDDESVLAAAGQACREAISGLGTRPLGVVAFDCETRSRFLGPGGRRDEVALMAAGTAPAPVAGLYTWGEIARTRGINGFHNQTLVVLAVG